MVLQDTYSSVKEICAAADDLNQPESAGRKDEATFSPLDKEQLTERISASTAGFNNDQRVANIPSSALNAVKSEGSSAENQNFNGALPSPSSALSEQQNQHSSQPKYDTIREADRLSGFIRRYENKLETICKSLLSSSSSTSVVVHGEEKKVQELSLPEMFDFIIDQDWYKARSPGTKSAKLFTTGVTRNSTLPTENNTKENFRFELDVSNDVLYTITNTGRSFLTIDGPARGDVGRFLSYLANSKDGRTRSAISGHWKEIANLSGDTHSTRVCHKLNETISFCLDSQMIEQMK